MFKLAVILFLVGTAAASGYLAGPLVTSQRAIINHYSPYNYYGNGISARYQTKADYGYGVGLGLINPYGYYGSNYNGLGGLGYYGSNYNGLGGLGNYGQYYNGYCNGGYC